MEYQRFHLALSKFSALFFSFFAVGGTAGANIGSGLILLTCLLDKEFYIGMFRSKYFLIFLLFLFYLLLNIFVINYDPDVKNVKELKSIVILFGFPLFFVVLKKTSFSIDYIFNCFILGFFVHVVLSKDFWENFINFHRTGYHLPIIFFSLVCAIIGLWCIIQACSNQRNDRKIDFYLLCVFVISLILLAQSRTRTTWLPVLLLTPFLIGALWSNLISLYARHKTMCRCWFVAFVLIAAFSSHAVWDRLHLSVDSINDIEVGTEEGVQRASSIKNRYNLIVVGLGAVAEKPLFGHGVDSTERINLSVKNQYVKLMQKGELRGFDNFHSFYIEVASQLGLPVLLMLCWAIVYYFWRYRALWFRSDYNIFFLFGALLIIGWSLFETRHFHFDFRNFWIFFMGISLYGLENDRKQSLS